jgi:N-methylhydantoinase A
VRQTTRPVFFQGHGLVDCPIVQRQDLPAGFQAEGPMVIEEVVSTTLVHPGQRVAVDEAGVIRIDLSSRG